MRDRTADLLRARQALSQLSYNPIVNANLITGIHSVWNELVGLSGLEPPTSPLSGVRSNHLSYKPVEVFTAYFSSDNLCEHYKGRFFKVRR